MSEFQRDTGELAVLPLSEQQREAYPNVVYQHESNSRMDNLVLASALTASQRVGLPLTADREFSEEHGAHITVIRSASDDRFKSSVESALFHGLTSALGNQLRRDPDDSPDLLPVATNQAEAMLRQITDNEELYEGFTHYYGGSRWSMDEEKFDRVLFEHAAPLDLELIDKAITGSKARYILEKLGIEYELPEGMSYSEWAKLTPDEVFELFPTANYLQLHDDVFAKSDEGQKLAERYRKFCGSLRADDYHAYPGPVTDDGVAIPRPLVPLKSFPVIEALMADVASMVKPRAKYDLGPGDVTEFVYRSDSVVAQRAAVEGMTHRLPKEDRYVFDGPNEFEQKRRTIHRLISAYNNSFDTPDRRAEFKDQLLTVFDAYMGDGIIAQDVRADYEARKNHRYPDTQDIRGVKDIISDIMVFGLASPDAETFIAHHMPDLGNGLTTEADPLILTPAENVFIILDALSKVTTASNPKVFELFGSRVFKDSDVGRRLAEIAELHIEARALLEQPAVLSARKNLRQFPYTIGDKSPEYEAARQALDEQTAPANSLSERATQLKNDLLLECMTQLIDSGHLSDENNDPNKFFKGVLDRVSMGSIYRAESLPAIYNELLAMADRPDLPDREKSSILWRVSEAVKYTDGDPTRLFVPTALNMYRIMLGDPDNLRLPSGETSLGLAAVTNIAHENKIFKYANEEELQLLGRYKTEILDFAERVLAGAITTGDKVPAFNADEYRQEDGDLIRNFKNVFREMERLEDLYGKYLHIERVKVDPNVYYPWVLEQLAPFWQKMQWEVSPGNQPQADVKALHGVLKNHIAKLLVIQDEPYPEDFDSIEDGNLGSLLLEGYNRMIVPHDIKYVTTVYHDGLTFMHYAVNYMPESLFEQLKAKYAHRPDFIDYMQKSRDHWRKED